MLLCGVQAAFKALLEQIQATPAPEALTGDPQSPEPSLTMSPTSSPQALTAPLAQPTQPRSAGTIASAEDQPPQSQPVSGVQVRACCFLHSMLSAEA